MAVSASQDLLQLCCWGCQCFCSTSGPLHCPRITEDGIWNNLSGGYHNLFHISQTCGDGMDYIYIYFQDSTISYLFWACYTPNCLVFTTKSIRMVDSGRPGTVVEVDQLFKVQLAQRLRPSGSFYNGGVIKRMALRGKTLTKTIGFGVPKHLKKP